LQLLGQLGRVVLIWRRGAAGLGCAARLSQGEAACATGLRLVEAWQGLGSGDGRCRHQGQEPDDMSERCFAR
jgi:hypothetical protein